MKVIMILLDGMRSDSFDKIPFARKVMGESMYTLTGQTVFPSVTLACHMSLFHSVAPDRHGITGNVYMPQVRPVTGLFELLQRNGKACAHFYDWEQLRDISLPGSLAHSGFYAGRTYGYRKTAQKLTEELIDYARTYEPDFTFLFLGLTDAVGHKYGWMSEKYLAAIEESWGHVEQIMTQLGDEYTYIITADHGGHQRSHGTDLPEDMTIPILIRTADRKTGMLEDANIMDLAPTVAEMFGIAPDEDWEGKSLL